MDPKQTQTRGLGGVFLRAADPNALTAWYARTFGFDQADYGINLHSRDTDGREALTVFAFFGRADEYFDPSQAAMINLRVDDLEASTLRLGRARESVRVQAGAEQRAGRIDARVQACGEGHGAYQASLEVLG